MTPPLYTVSPDAKLPQIEYMLEDLDVSGIAVVDAEFRPLGVITRTDLLHAGAVPTVSLGRHGHLELPDRRVGDTLAGAPSTIDVGQSMEAAVEKLQKERIHRLLVVEQGRLVGVLSTWDVMATVAEARLKQPLGTLMSASVVTLSPEANTASAIERLQNAHVHGLVVVERGWPIGVFGQEEALAAERWPQESKVDQWFSPAVLSMPASMPVHRAAAQAVATRTRHLVVMELDGIGGIVTTSDFLHVERN